MTEAQDSAPYIELDGPEAQRLIVEIAADPESRERGLMFRSVLEADHGMLFVFPEPVLGSVWGKGCMMPLSAAFLSAEGVVLEVHDIEPGDERAITPRDRFQYLVEAEQGWFRRHGITPGRRMRFHWSAGPVRVR